MLWLNVIVDAFPLDILPGLNQHPAVGIVTVKLFVVAGITRQFHDLTDFGKGQVKGTLPQFLHQATCLSGVADVGMQFVVDGQSHCSASLGSFLTLTLYT